MADEMDVDEYLRRQEWEWLERIACTRDDGEAWTDQGLSFIAVRAARLILQHKAWIEEQDDAVDDLKARVEAQQRTIDELCVALMDLKARRTEGRP